MKIKNIIFDLGGVILNLDQNRTLNAFKLLGADLEAYNESLSIFKEYETGKIDSYTFKQTIHLELKGTVSHEQIEIAWNSMLLDLPPRRVELVQKLKTRYRLILLSNTNTMHMDDIYKVNGREIFDSLFDKIYLSHEIGLRKPNLDCYDFVLKDAGLLAHETIFIDDSITNIKGAEAAGIRSILALEPLDGWIEDELVKVEMGTL
ncbi:MAG: HAD family phosphatase [Bacteroidota bacterium]|nr:HAD family phosphatase [Bacteroidota bacterium]